MALARFGYYPILRSRLLTTEDQAILERISKLRFLVADEKEKWLSTSNNKTYQGLSRLDSLLVALCSALQAESHRLERTVTAIQDHNMKELVLHFKARTSKNKQLAEQLKQNALKRRKEVQLELMGIIHDIHVVLSEESVTLLD